MFAAIIDLDELNMSMELGDPFALIDVLLRHRVPIVVIGGYAVAYYGYVRATEDIDILFDRTPESEPLLLAALREIDAYWISDEIDHVTGIEKTFPVTQDFIARNHLMMLGTRFGYVDIFDFVPEISGAQPKQLILTADDSTGRPFVSLDWLKRMKGASQRAKDQDDLRHLP